MWTEFLKSRKSCFGFYNGLYYIWIIFNVILLQDVIFTFHF